MRISDWSSDVCSSDLELHVEEHRQPAPGDGAHAARAVRGEEFEPELDAADSAVELLRQGLGRVDVGRVERHEDAFRRFGHGTIHKSVMRTDLHRRESGRSEEHTSELQSLLRISYAVFCCKKKQ